MRYVDMLDLKRRFAACVHCLDVAEIQCVPKRGAFVAHCRLLHIVQADRDANPCMAWREIGDRSRLEPLSNAEYRRLRDWFRYNPGRGIRMFQSFGGYWAIYPGKPVFRFMRVR